MVMDFVVFKGMSFFEAAPRMYQYIHQLFKSCHHCGRWDGRPSLYCICCENLLWKTHPAVSVDWVQDIRVSYLFHWVPDSDRQVSRLLLSLKGGRPQSAIQFYCEQFLARAEICGDLRNSILVPCPSHRGRDHALVLAEEFSKVLDIPVHLALERASDPGQQRRLDLRSREKIRFKSCSNLREKHVIFIDDIVTTGATVMAARRAMKGISGFEVWTLARRRLLAPDLTL
ncbi:MAG: hypothetical protein COT73_08945 [Bdellovibrio sp. CG10_big_fil_rev_8_21_14_0_10_47_8]|nr:MAG: hypothetical protein COT73_08945 [Bdellovibrio sp. CG10_big_fil_rev_8_21_14_0_10_47_8]